MPFGGTKASGYGRFGGPEGLRSLTNPKAITMDRWPSLVQTFIPKVLDYPIRSMSRSWCVFFIFAYMHCRSELFFQGILKQFGAVPLRGWLAH